MKAFATLIATLFVCTAAQGALGNYTLDMSLFVNDKPFGNPKIQVESGQFASVVKNQKDRTTFIEVMATEVSENKTDGILMDFKIGKILKDGTRQTLSKGKIIGTAGEEAVIEIHNKKKSERIKLSVVATRS